MKSLTLTFLLSLGLVGILRAQEGPKTENQKVLYALGVALGRQVADFRLSAEEIKFATQGFKDSASGKTLKVNMREYGPKVGQFAQAKTEANQAREAAKAVGEKEKSKKFLETAAKEKGATAMPSGLIYASLQEGKGASPQATDKVKVHYKGTLIDGKVFDSSIDRGAPAEFPLNGVIACWTEGVQKMKVGGKAKLICPSSIAYGDTGHPPTIPGGATLVFEVELLDILK